MMYNNYIIIVIIAILNNFNNRFYIYIYYLYIKVLQYLQCFLYCRLDAIPILISFHLHIPKNKIKYYGFIISNNYYKLMRKQYTL